MQRGYLLCSLLIVTCALACGPVQQQPIEPVGQTPPDVQPQPTPSVEPAPAPATPAPAPVDPLVKLDSPSLLLQATPDIPRDLRKRLNQYLNTRSAGLNDISADGKRVLVTTRFGETGQVHLVDTPLGARQQLTFASEPAAGAQFVPGDPNAVIYTADIGGNEQYQIVRLDRSTGRTTVLTDPASRNGAALWSTDGKWLAYYSNARNKRDFDIWISDGKDPGSARRIVDVSGWWAPLAWSPDSKYLLALHYISANISHLYAIDVASKQVTRVSPENAKSTYRVAVFGKTSKTIYVASDREGEFAELYETDLTGSKWRSLTRSIPWDVASMAMSRDGRTLAFTSNEGGFSRLYLLDARSRRFKPAAGIPKGRISGLQFAARANTLGFTFSSATQTGDAYTYDVRRRKLVRFTRSEIGGLNPDTLIEPELIEYTSFDGTKIPAFYARPKGKGPFPVIISIHGGPEGQARPRFRSMDQFLLAEKNIAILYPNVRGSSGYGKTYLTLDNGKKREDSVKDIGALLDWIGKRPELDAKRVGVYGGSYGGYMVLASLVHYSDRIVAGVDVVGISSFVTFLENTADYRRNLRRVEYGDESLPEMRAFLEKISPLNSIGKIKSALFVAQGANDPRVPASEAEQIVKAVRASGHDVWYMLAKNEGHGFRKKVNRDTFILLTTMFFDKHLGTGD